MNILHNLLVALVYPAMLVVLVAAHELGHYLFARLFGMSCEEFAVGMGGRKPWIYARRRYSTPVAPEENPHARGESNGLEGGGSTVTPIVEDLLDGRFVLHETTLFTVRPLPLGGFVRIKGMVPQADGGETRIPGGFFSKAPWKRWIVLAAGPAFSVLAGILLLFSVFEGYGYDKPTGRPVLKGVISKEPAYEAGLRAGDRIVSIDGVPTATWYDVVRNVRDKGKSPIALVIQRGGETIRRSIVGKVDDAPSDALDKDGHKIGSYRQTKLGAAAETRQERLPLGEALTTAVVLPYEMVADLAGRFSRPKELADSLGGPGTMIAATSDAVDEGAWGVIRLAGLLSISVGIFNLLPFPPLDGGQMWIAIVEMLRGGRRLSIATQERVITLGFGMVMLLVVTILALDVRRFTGFAGGEAPPKIERGK